MLQPFTRTRLLSVEGDDEVNFFEKLLEYMGISHLVDIRKSGGKDKFKDLMQAYTLARGFRNIEMIAVIRDADKNAKDAFRSVTGVLKKIGLKAPGNPGQFSSGIPAVGIFIMPDNSSGGMLEDLCLDTVKDHEAMKCVDDFIVCTQKLKEGPKNIPKARVQAFLAAKPKIVNSIGLGAQKGYWDFDSQRLQPLISFLNQLK
ncbi:MAG: hypothetical protein GTO45_35000 [Candidatus Aminicenantes bacterium]|nr:hypothetical protein [Candidatus Aminicenantes bacterium]NIM83900.1 hypothetical protein [Candidatus Aminicenantes bacterium]NIN23366.1 hypothetical protein [Candidatus Aminicenantes bacterium]NIN47068.1 hypothetical protein [Candidatus Aminicenantes bacterium]NIN89992.1 hypothetical protein [Candidatus Aminicenantes bacterium]